MLGVKLSYNIFIIILLFVCIWFFNVSKKDKSLVKNMFQGLMWFCLVMFLNRLWGICLTEKAVYSSDTLIIIQKMIHYLLINGIYVFYIFLIAALLYQLEFWSVWKKILVNLPNIIIYVLIITTPWTGFIFSYSDGEFKKGSLFYVMITVRALYAVAGSYLALKKRDILPGIFAKGIILSVGFAFFEFVFYTFTNDETLFYATMVIIILILLLVLTVVSFYKDSQTGLLNLEAFEQYINKEISGKRCNEVLLIKLKNFDYLRENCTDKSLTIALKELAVCIKEYSLLTSVYYIGNGRYSMVIPRNGKFENDAFFDKLRERFCVPFDVNGASIPLALFISVIRINDDKVNKYNFWKFFNACDGLKYKSNELIEIVYGDNFGVDQLQRYKDVEDAIDRALVEKEFKMYYQPIISTKTKKIVSCEALIRLYDRVLGFISPEEFIPISESNGRILDISEYVLNSVFKFVSENDLKALGIQFVEMNLSMIQCMDTKLPDKLLLYSQKYGVDPEFINLEITETASSFDEELLKRQLNKIKNLGFSFSLDDYGTGYSNLVRVLEYPVDIIKLDKSIVWSAFHNKDNFLAVKNLITMFHDVRRKIVAEGVENQEQMQKLEELGCDLLQGYFYSKPVPDSAFIDFTRKFN